MEEEKNNEFSSQEENLDELKLLNKIKSGLLDDSEFIEKIYCIILEQMKDNKKYFIKEDKKGSKCSGFPGKFNLKKEEKAYESKYKEELKKQGELISEKEKEIIRLKRLIKENNEKANRLLEGKDEQKNNMLREKDIRISKILKEKDAENERKISELISENSQVINSLREELSNKNERIIELNNYIDKLKSCIDEIQSLKEKQHNQILKLESEKDEKDRSIEKYKNAQKKLNEQLENLNYKLQNQGDIIISLQNQNEKLNKEFSDIKKAYQIFLDIDEQIKHDLISILKNDSIENFIYAGVQYKNIESIWEYAKNRAINGQLEDLDKLEKIIFCFLNSHNMIYNKPIYRIQEFEIGSNFDEDKFIRGYNSKIVGEISQVSLHGYTNLINNKIVKKSVVKIG